MSSCTCSTERTSLDEDYISTAAFTNTEQQQHYHDYLRRGSSHIADHLSQPHCETVLFRGRGAEDIELKGVIGSSQYFVMIAFTLLLSLSLFTPVAAAPADEEFIDSGSLRIVTSAYSERMDMDFISNHTVLQGPPRAMAGVAPETFVDAHLE